MIEDLCKRIKNKRKESGYSIEEVVKKTKLYPSVLRDIEDCNLGNVSKTYLKGFIKIYASFLGVEIKDELEDLSTAEVTLKKQKNQKKPETGESLSVPFYKKVSGVFSRIPLKLKKNIFFGVVALLVLWLGFLGVRFSFRVVLNFFRSRPVVEREAAVPPSQDLSSLSGPIDRVAASLTARRRCYIRVFADGEPIFEGMLESGEMKSWRAEDELEIVVNDGSAVHLEVDGEPIPRLSALRRRKRLIINSSGITIE